MASRANQRFLLGCALLCAAALPCADSSRLKAAESQPQSSVASANFPIASAARLAGDGKQTRFILDIDQTVTFRAITLADPYRVVVDVPQVNFQLPAGTGAGGRGLVKAFRYGLVMPGGSRIVFDLAGPAKIANSYVVEAANGQPARLVLELEEVDRAAFVPSLAPENRPELRPAIADPPPATVPGSIPPESGQQKADGRAVVVIDPGHGGIDNGTQSSGESEKNLVLAFGLALRERLEKTGKYRVVMTRDDDTFIPLNDRVKVARALKAALFVSIHADALPRAEGDAQGATIYTLSDKASDAEAQRLADAENRADAIAGFNLAEEPTDVADILIDLTQRETRTFSSRFARLLMGEMKSTVRMHKHPLEVGRLPRAEGARCAVGAGRDRLRLQQGRPRASGLRGMAVARRGLDGAGDRRVPGQAHGHRGIVKLTTRGSSN
ncbi:N-acetylmuramoyl-L-alanine amidase [Bradyrhizobium sp. LB9.1b]